MARNYTRAALAALHLLPCFLGLDSDDESSCSGATTTSLSLHAACIHERGVRNARQRGRGVLLCCVCLKGEQHIARGQD